MNIMNATNATIFRQRIIPQGRQLLHAVSSTIDSSNAKAKGESSPGPHKQSRNNFVAAAVPTQPTANDIDLLLSRIGVSHRASLPMIDSMIQKNAPVTAQGMIDLIAQIRSI